MENNNASESGVCIECGAYPKIDGKHRIGCSNLVEDILTGFPVNQENKQSDPDNMHESILEVSKSLQAIFGETSCNIFVPGTTWELSGNGTMVTSVNVSCEPIMDIASMTMGGVRTYMPSIGSYTSDDDCDDEDDDDEDWSDYESDWYESTAEYDED